MKHMKMLGLVTVAAAALMAFAGTAWANELTTPQGKKIERHAKIKATSEGEVYFDSVSKVSCALSHMELDISNTGGKEWNGDKNHPTTPTEAEVESLEFTNCGKDTVTTLKGGTLIVTSLGGNAGTVTSNETELTVQIHRTVLGFPITTHCVLKTNNTDIGELTGTGNGGITTATLHVSALLTHAATDSACGEASGWFGSYQITTPDHLWVD